MNYCKIDKDNIETNLEGTLVPWWSFGKTLLATAILKLVEMKKLKLEGKYFEQDVTLLQVLRHEAGYGDYAYTKDYQTAVNEKHKPWSFDTMIEKTNNHDLIFEPGSRWQYSNIGYYHLRCLIEKTTGLSLMDGLNSLVFQAIGIGDVILAKNQEDLINCAYIKGDYDPLWLYHGLFLGSLESACRFLNSLSQGKILSRDTLDIMQDVYKLNFDIGNRPWQKPAYGLGIMVDDRSDEYYSFGHTGMGPDSVISVYHFPKLHPPKTIGIVENTKDQALVENTLVKLIK